MAKLSLVLVTFESWLEIAASHLIAVWGRHRVGILGTIVLNLLLMIALLSLEMRSQAHLYESIVLVDFDREFEILPPDEAIPPPAPLLPPDATNPWLESEAIRNIALDASRDDLNPGLIDEKMIDAEKLYRDAQLARERMQANRELLEDSRGIDNVEIPNIEQKIIPPEEVGQYQGPTVISYNLKNRRAHHLPVPSYKCELGGQVVVDIEVQRDGRVARATIDAALSVRNDCIEIAAIAAALGSRFSASSHAEAHQRGSITYLFVPQR